MATAELSRRVGRVVGYPTLVDMDDRQRREFHGQATPSGRGFQKVASKDDPQEPRGGGGNG
jgi:hypothetical protein